MTPRSKSHILIFPYPSAGHITPLVNLAHQLAIRGLTITIIVSPHILPLLNPLISRHPSIKTLVFSFPTHPNHSVGVENARGLPANSVRDMLRTLSQLYDPILNWCRSQSSPPVAILSDKFLGWTYHLARQLNIPRIAFSPSAAIAVSIIYTQWRDLPKRIDPNDENEIVEFQNIPNSPKYPWWQLSPFYCSFVEGEVLSEFFRDGILANIASSGLVINTYNELEGFYLDYLKRLLGHDRVWAVGPLFPPNDGLLKPIENVSHLSPGDVLEWLDAREENSVVYVCFGSMALLTNKQMEMLALGLEKSEANFVWSIREPVKDDYNLIPSGFEDRVVGRGLVVKGWVPQVPILTHRAVGAFMTHFGWNSILEGLVAGVPLLGWPMGAEQFMNATLLVDQLQVAIRVCEGAQTIPDATHLARVVVESVSNTMYQGERAKALALHNAALDAIRENGTSFQDLERLVMYLVESNASCGKQCDPTNNIA